MDLSSYIPIMILAGLLLCAIGFDLIINKSWFNYSLELIGAFQAQYPHLEAFFKGLSALCSEYILLPYSLIIFFIFPMNYSFCFISTLLISTYLDNVMKIIYGNPRPFWENEALFKACDGGFGNPSGHSFVSTATYLALAHLLTKFNTLQRLSYKTIVNVIIFIVAIMTIIGIMTSRIFLGVHSLNQVVYGSFLGCIVYYLHFFVLGLQKMAPKDFIDFINGRLSILFYSLSYLLAITVGIMLYYFIDNTPEQKWIDALLRHCPNIHEYRRFNNDAFFSSLLVCFIIGVHYGMIVLIKVVYKESNDSNGNTIPLEQKALTIVYWYSGSFKQIICKVLLLLPFLVFLAMFILISSSTHLSIIFILKTATPMLMTGFLFYGPYILSCYYLKLIPSNILAPSAANINNDHLINNNNQEDEELHQINSYQ